MNFERNVKNERKSESYLRNVHIDVILEIITLYFVKTFDYFLFKIFMISTGVYKIEHIL